MKKKFHDKTQVKFAIPRFKYTRNGNCKKYTIKMLIPNGCQKVIENSRKITDEGFETTYKVMVNNNGKLALDVYTSARDCDGYCEEHTQFVLTSTGWEKIGRVVNDYAAQAMGY